MENLDKVFDRVRKLLKLAEGGNENEAALAAERAAELMREHALTEAEVRLSATGDTLAAAPAPIVQGFEADATKGDGKKAHAWKLSLAWGVCRSFNCRFWRIAGRVHIFGREPDVRAADYTLAYLVNEVDRLTDKGAEERGRPGKAWCNSFRMGCAHRIQETLLEKARKRQVERQEILKRAAEVEEAQDQGADEEVIRALVPQRALVEVARSEEEVDAAYEEVAARRWGKRRAKSYRGSVSSAEGWHAGRAAGASVAIGSARGALGPGQGRLK